jgi:GH25 family lysozyme M1 (1,4-beta-N-acetylmuramidase)
VTPNSDGPDISHHNPVANWDAIPPYRLFSTKATEGKTFRSPTFDENWEQMRRRAFQFRGCYHWVRSDSPMYVQVANLKRAVDDHGGLKRGEFIQVDWETTPGIADVSYAQITEFIALCEQEWPGRCIVYASDWVPFFIQWRLANPTYPLWYANYNTGDRSTGGWAECAKYGADVWQWTSSAPIPGIADATCDMNHVFKWDTLYKITSTMEVPPVMPAFQNYVAQPPAERPGMPWFTKINGVVEYATAADFPNDMPVAMLSVEQYDWMFRSKFGTGETKVTNFPATQEVSVTNWPPPTAGTAFPSSFTLTGDITPVQ